LKIQFVRQVVTVRYVKTNEPGKTSPSCEKRNSATRALYRV